jgi:3',5'-cyclic AMP phosphodiesterase CpdA
MLIAQISDLHLKPEGALAYGVADTATRLQRTVEHINTLNPMPDIVLITGDLVDEGARGSYLYVRQLLTSLKPPFLIVPGNHDHKEELCRTFPEHTYLRENVPENSESSPCFAYETFPLRLIGLDTVTQGEYAGGLSPERLQWLEDTLCQRTDMPTIIFMHHPPFASGIGSMDTSPFRGREEFANIIQHHSQVERILCGHLHRPAFRRFAGTIVTTCPAIGMQLVLDLAHEIPVSFVMEPPAVMLHLYANPWGDGHALVTHISVVEETPHQYSGPHPFEEKEGLK